jgi:hypothetical protein
VREVAEKSMLSGMQYAAESARRLNAGWVRQVQFATFPDVLVLHAKKFQLVNWVPTKLGESAVPVSDTNPMSLNRRYTCHPSGE